MFALKTPVAGGEVSTVDTLDNGLETCVFADDGGSWVGWAYSNLQQALDGHKVAVAEVVEAGGAQAWLKRREDERLARWALEAPDLVGYDYARMAVDQIAESEGLTTQEAAKKALREGVQFDQGPVPSQVWGAVQSSALGELERLAGS